jgi:hypothetical protein
MPPRRILLSTRTTDPAVPSHRRRRILRDGSTDDQEETKNKKNKQQRIAPCPLPRPFGIFDYLNRVERLVTSITQSPLGSTTVVESPHRSPRLLKVARISNVQAAVKSKQKVSGFKLNNASIYAWFRDDSVLFSYASASSLKRKAQNNF